MKIRILINKNIRIPLLFSKIEIDVQKTMENIQIRLDNNFKRAIIRIFNQLKDIATKNQLMTEHSLIDANKCLYSAIKND